MHDSCISAPYILTKLKDVQGMVQGMSYWIYSDLFKEPGSPTAPFQGGFGFLNVVYALVLGLPTAPIVVKAMGSAAATQPGRIAKVEVLGTNERVRWKQHGDGLHLELPKDYRPKVDYAVSFKVSLD